MNFRRYLPRMSLRILFVFIMIIAAGSAWYAQRRNWEIQRTEQLRRLESEYVLERDLLSCRITQFGESRTFARTVFGEQAAPAIQKIKISPTGIHDLGTIRATFAPKPLTEWFDYRNVPELEELWVSDYIHIASIPSAKHLTELQEFGCVSYVQGVDCPREHDQLVSNYIAAFPNLPKLKFFAAETRNFNERYSFGPLNINTKFLRSNDVHTLINKAPALEELHLCINNLDEQTIIAFKPLKDLKILSIRLRERDADKYFSFAQSLLQLPRLEELYVANICADLYPRTNDAIYDSSYRSDCTAFYEGMRNSQRELKIHHQTLKHVMIFEVPRVEVKDCPLLETARFPCKDKEAETKQSNCPKLGL